MMQKLLKSKSFYSVALSVVLSFVFVAVVTSAATTISTNISTGGTLTVTGVTQLNGALQASSTALVATTTLSGESPLVLGQSTTDLTGQVEGTLFYDSTNKFLRLYDGNAWFTVATTTGGLTVVGVRSQLTNVGTEHVAIGTTTVLGNLEQMLTVEATSTTAVPLTVVGATAQTADLLRVVRCDNCDTSYTEVFAIDAYGSASTTASWDMAYNVDSAYFSVSGRATTTGATGAIATEGNLTVTGTIAANGAVTLGDAITDAITITGAATTSASLTIGAAGILDLGGFGTSTATGGFYLGATSTIASTTPAEEFTVTGDAYFSKDGTTDGTTTINIKSNGTAKGGCLEMENGEDTVSRIYLNPAGTGFIIELGACQ